MQIKYGELTIIHNKDSFDIFTNLTLWMGRELSLDDKSKLLFIFEDDEDKIFESDNIYDFNFEFSDSCLNNMMPLYFKKNIKNKFGYKTTYFQKEVYIKDNLRRLDMGPLFSAYKKYNISDRLGSIYNCIYYYFNPTKKEIFGLLKIKSNEHMPRFLFAYDSDEFTKEEIVYLIKKLFNYKNYKNY
jgi:hypothetical protein